ncbi:hypothetical protein Sulku_0783 [Sulfuricurvum kujiense DSM 16994]|uniref:Uncharacterized protein n=1 Tax=Sulfuricurvum kujiense (strain ATCC BAA-921 / DSM 16994 / JCM 11577 / YK-1) TaxID=709032 RepID=E4U1L3_SULKY|nr:hypothetical protein [Sulfuricurvum kujiense]ADR33449.1 hypothetical protein Sulku_0783 [Sulfuricurvum kujiense DSM 16994]
MQVTSYTFQTPYPQPFQVGRPDPASTKKEDSTQNTGAVENQKVSVGEAKIKPTLDSGIYVSLSTLESGSSQKGVSEFKSLSSVNQAQKAYSVN